LLELETGGKNAAPPKDCGGVLTYMEMGENFENN